jgi:hypothetical protein
MKRTIEKIMGCINGRYSQCSVWFVLTIGCSNFNMGNQIGECPLENEANKSHQVSPCGNSET